MLSHLTAFEYMLALKAQITRTHSAAREKFLPEEPDFGAAFDDHIAMLTYKDEVEANDLSHLLRNSQKSHLRRYLLGTSLPANLLLSISKYAFAPATAVFSLTPTFFTVAMIAVAPSSCIFTLGYYASKAAISVTSTTR